VNAVRWIFALVIWSVAASALPAPALAGGAWTSFLRAFKYTDLIADGDTVWCATREAGLLRFSRAGGRFESLVREPGGLASNRVTAIAFDRSRRLWVGTDDAGASVLSADRASWGAVNAFDGLPSLSITALEAQGDTVWIGTAGGLALWDGREIAGVLPDRTGPSPFASNVIRGLAVLGDSVWVATADGAYLSRLTSGLATWTALSGGLPTRDIAALASDGRVLLALDSLRVHRFDPATSAWTRTPGIGDVHGLSDDLGTISATGVNGIYRWNGTGWTLINSTLRSFDYPCNNNTTCRLFAVTVDGTGRTFAANLTGLYAQPDGSGPWPGFSPPGPPGNDVLNLALDGERLYVTTTVEGFGRYDGSAWTHWPPTGAVYDESDSTFRDPTYGFALLVDRAGRKWVGSWDVAMEVFSDSSVKPRFEHKWPTIGPCCREASCRPACEDTTASHTFAWASAADSAGGHWFGMDSPREEVLPAIGLEYYDDTSHYAASYRPGTSRLRGGKIRALTVDHRGRVWVGYAGQGIDYFGWPPSSGTAPTFVHVSRTDNDDVEGLVATRNAVWALTTGEVRRYSLSGDFEASYTVPAGPFDLAVNPMDATPDGSVWVGTANGIRVYKPDDTTQDYNTSNSPLADDGIRAIRVDRRTGIIWIGTSMGISRFDPAYVPPSLSVPRLQLRASPNPARISALGIGLRLSANAAAFDGEVYDLSGRLLRRFRAASGDVIWDGRGPDGTLVKPGVYFVRAKANGRFGAVRVALVR
jgi:ligand-binding sensor domain-containing protein